MGATVRGRRGKWPSERGDLQRDQDGTDDDHPEYDRDLLRILHVVTPPVQQAPFHRRHWRLRAATDLRHGRLRLTRTRGVRRDGRVARSAIVVLVLLDPLDLEQLFCSPSMFDSRADWLAAGFDVLDRRDDADKIMVGRHPLAPGILFKKYSSGVSRSRQYKNYARRIEGADRLRAFVTDRQLQHIVVPNKRVVELPPTCSRTAKPSHVLVVEEIDLTSHAETKEAYRRIGAEVLRELCLVLFSFRGLDSITDNVSFTTGGKLAFIDTENWHRGSRRRYLCHIGEYLTPEARVLSEQLFRALEEGGDHYGRDASGAPGSP